MTLTLETPSYCTPYWEGFQRGLRPVEALSVSEWADTYAVLPREGGAKEPGQYRTSRFPYLREIMDNMSPHSPVPFEIIIKGTQLGFTQAALNVCGHTIDIDPAPMMYLLPTIEVAKRHSRSKVKSMIAHTPRLRSKVPEAKEKDSGNTMLMKEFPGGYLVIAGANSAASLRNLSVKKLILDEVDAYNADLEKEGDTCSIAMKRTDAFGDTKKIMMISTPTIKGASKSETEFLNSDQRHYHVPCPHCGHRQALVKDGFEVIETEAHEVIAVYYRCTTCAGTIEEHHKTKMLAEGLWVPYNPGHRRRGYKLPSWYSPMGFLSWIDLWQEYVDAKRSGDMEQMKTWKNTRAAETWDEQARPDIDESAFTDRCEAYAGSAENPLPMPCLVLTAAVDNQKDRIEVEVKGHGLHNETWTVDYRIIPGAFDEQQTQDDLTTYISTSRWQHASGAHLGIELTLFDSGGHYTQQVYDYCRANRKLRIFSSKGSQFTGKPLVEKASRQKKAGKATRLDYIVGPDTAKRTVFNRLQIPARALTDYPESGLFAALTDQEIIVNPNYMHFNQTCDAEYFRQIVAERLVEKRRSGKTVQVYEQIGNRANEALDLNCLNLAAIRVLNPFCSYWSGTHKEHLLYSRNIAWWKRQIDKIKKLAAQPAPDPIVVTRANPPRREAEETPVETPKPEPKPKQSFIGKVRQQRRGGWVSRW